MSTVEVFALGLDPQQVVQEAEIRSQVVLLRTLIVLRQLQGIMLE